MEVPPDLIELLERRTLPNSRRLSGNRRFSLGIALAMLLTATFQSSAEMIEPTPDAILQSAFDTRFNFDVVQLVELRAQSEMGEQRRTIQIATKRIGDSLHGVGYFVSPAELRGMRLLMIERFDRNDDFFLFLPMLGRVRRVSSAQRADAFMGTDLTYEDFERRYVKDYEVQMIGLQSLQGEEAYEIRCTPKYDSGHEAVAYFVAKSDHAILEIRYTPRSHDEPTRVQQVPRDGMIYLDGHIVPTRMWVMNRQQNTRTEVRFSHTRINPTLEASLFTQSALEVGRPIPFLPR